MEIGEDGVAMANARIIVVVEHKRKLVYVMVCPVVDQVSKLDLVTPHFVQILELGANGDHLAHARRRVAKEHREWLVVAAVVYVSVEDLKLEVVKLKVVKIFAQQQDGVWDQEVDSPERL